MSYKLRIEDAEVRTEHDSDADLSWLDQTDEQMGEGFEKHARERIAQYERGEWGMIGIYARAEVRFGTDEGGFAGGFEVRSPGLWGIESDSDISYLESVAKEELSELRDMLEALEGGIPADEIESALAGLTLKVTT